MNISDAKKLDNGAIASTVGVLVKNSLMPKQGGGHYLQVGLKDASAIIEFPVFDRADIIHEKLIEGNIYMVRGTVNVWNGNVQIKSPVFTPLSLEDALKNLGREYFLPSYSKESIDNAISYLNETINEMGEPWKTFVSHATGFVDTKGDMFNSFVTCPSAEKHHGAKLGGLLIHTVGVLKVVKSMIEQYVTDTISDYVVDNPVVNVDRLITKAIVHDIKKIDEYEYSTVIRRTPGVIGHLIDGVGYIETVNNNLGNTISKQDMESLKYSILSHHGQYGPYKPESLEDQIIHLADMIDSRFVGTIENNH